MADSEESEAGMLLCLCLQASLAARAFALVVLNIQLRDTLSSACCEDVSQKV